MLIILTNYSPVLLSIPFENRKAFSEGIDKQQRTVMG